MVTTVAHIEHRLNNAATIGYSLEELDDDLGRVDMTEDSVRDLFDLDAMKSGVTINYMNNDEDTRRIHGDDLIAAVVSSIAEGSFEDMVGSDVLRTKRFDIFWREIGDIQESQAIFINRSTGNVYMTFVDTHCFGEDDYQTGYTLLNFGEYLTDIMHDCVLNEESDDDDIIDEMLANARTTLQLSLGRIGNDAYTDKALNWISVITAALNQTGHQLSIEAYAPAKPHLG